MMTINFCERCLTRVHRCGVDTVELFKTICETYLEDGIPPEIYYPYKNQKEPFCQVLIFLEENGFIVTSESGFQFIRIKPCGIVLKPESNQPHFCIGIDNHN